MSHFSKLCDGERFCLEELVAHFDETKRYEQHCWGIVDSGPQITEIKRPEIILSDDPILKPTIEKIDLGLHTLCHIDLAEQFPARFQHLLDSTVERSAIRRAIVDYMFAKMGPENPSMSHYGIFLGGGYGGRQNDAAYLP